MNSGLALLDQSIGLAEQGLQAAEQGEFDTIIDLAAKWNELKNTALEKYYDPSLNGEFLKRCDRLRELSEKITEIAKTKQETVRTAMQNSKKEQSRMRGYHDAIRQARR